MQQAPEIAEGAADARTRYPKFTEKQCHSLKQKAAPDGGDEQDDIDDVGDSSQTRSCPLWMKCPAQEQRRDFVDAQVTIMTPQAFVHPLTAFYENTPFTAGSILYELWRRRMEASDPSVDLTFDNPEYERQFSRSSRSPA